MQDIISFTWKETKAICSNKGNLNVCPRGRPGPPGRAGPKGDRGRKGRIINETNTASFLCSVSGNPAAQIFWSKVNGSSPSNRTKVTSNGQMQIVSVRMEEAGEYKCLARNILGEEEKTAILVVQSRFKYYVLFD